MWIDSHAHLMSDGLYEDFDQLVINAKENNVKKILIICGNMKEVKRAFDKVENNPMFDLAIGVHPSDVADVSESEYQKMINYLDHPQVVAVGEIGLDYYWSTDHKELQIQRFKEQIELANKHNLPIIVHLRSSKEDILEILKKNTVKKHGVIHCFTEEVTDMKEFLKLGFYIGFGGIVTFKNGQNVRDSLLECPTDRILSETDSPYLAPVPKRGKRNEPAYVAHSIHEIGVLLELDDKDLSKQLNDNYKHLFERTNL